MENDKLTFSQLHKSDYEIINLIAEWYNHEWSIPQHITKQRFSILDDSCDQYQIVMLQDDHPIGTGGIFRQCDILDLTPELQKYEYWLSLVYTKPELRGLGLGAKLCSFMFDFAYSKGIQDMCLFTERSETLYKRLHWETITHLKMGDKDLTIMTKHFNS